MPLIILEPKSMSTFTPAVVSTIVSHPIEPQEDNDWLKCEEVADSLLIEYAMRHIGRTMHFVSNCVLGS